MRFDEFENDEFENDELEKAAFENDEPDLREEPVVPEPERIPVQPYIYEDEPQSMWSEPVYESASTRSPDAYTPGRYAYGARTSRPEAEPEPKRKKSHGFLKAVCLVLVCALLSGTASYFVVDYMLDRYMPEGSGAQVVLGRPVSSETDRTDAEIPAYTGKELTASQIYTLGKEQVVGVNSTGNAGTNIFGQSSPYAVSGSGFIISEDGYILTNYHVISYAVTYGGNLTVYTSDGTSYPATIKGYLESNDVAVIKIDAEGLTPAALGSSDDIIVGESVYAIGNPLGELEYTMTDGIVSAMDRVVTTTDELTGSTTSINMFQISAAVNAGNSGGPVYNSRGEVIGIVTAKYADSGVEGLGFAIPINDAVALATQIIEHGYVAGAGLGISGLDVTQVYASFSLASGIPYGVYVNSVNEGSAAETAGIQVGDIITGLGDRTITSMDELQLALRRYTPGDTETITIYRPGRTLDIGETLKLTITFEERVTEDSSGSQSGSGQQGGFGNWGFGGWGDFFGW